MRKVKNSIILEKTVLDSTNLAIYKQPSGTFENTMNIILH